jgi:putative transcriptional regulator
MNKKNTGSSNISCNLKILMNEKNITINQIALKTSLPYMTIKRYVENNCQMVSLDVLARICYVLNCEIGDLLKLNKRK